VFIQGLQRKEKPSRRGPRFRVIVSRARHAPNKQSLHLGTYLNVCAVDKVGWEGMFMTGGIIEHKNIGDIKRHR
jgi:hypothetical protein